MAMGSLKTQPLTFAGTFLRTEITNRSLHTLIKAEAASHLCVWKLRKKVSNVPTSEVKQEKSAGQKIQDKLVHALGTGETQNILVLWKLTCAQRFENLPAV